MPVIPGPDRVGTAEGGVSGQLPDRAGALPGVAAGNQPRGFALLHADADYTVLYASPDFATAFIETVVRDRFIRRREREVGLKEITARVWARISAQPGTLLTLLDLRGDGCARVGAPTDAVSARNHAAGRVLARSIHAEHADIDGLLHVSRLTGKDVYALFDRGPGKLDAAETGELADHPDLSDVLERHGLALVV